MGCTTSKHHPVCRNCQAPCSPMPRTYSMHVHHPPQRDGDTYHVVALTSTTLGSLQPNPLNQNHHINEAIPHIQHVDHDDDDDDHKQNFSLGVIEAKTWSKMIDEKIPKRVPKTPVLTPPGEPETINAWELMEGLEDNTSPLKPSHHFRSFSFHVGSNSITSPLNLSGSKPQEYCEETPKALWQEITENDSNSNDTSIVSEFDSDVITTFRKALEELPPANPFHLKPLEGEKLQAMACNNEALDITDAKNPPRGKEKEKLVLYFTSLRGVRKTYEDSCHVRVILKGLGFRLDERDVSMHSGFKEELKELLEDGFNGGGLPKVFVGKKYIGGAEEIRLIHEQGQLEKVLESCEMVEDGGGSSGSVCEACGDIRFMPCEACSGSCKIYYEGEDEYDEDEYGFQRCPDCNENGLIRCPICCD